MANRSGHRQQAMLGLLNAFAGALQRQRQRGGGDLPVGLKPIIRMV